MFLTIVLPEVFVMAYIECCSETETAIFAGRTNLPVLDFQTWQVWRGLCVCSVCKINNEELYFYAFPFENSYYFSSG